MRRWIAIGAGLALLAVTNHSIHSRERLLTEGRVVYLELAPVDPRSLMQGDYMALRFKVADDAFPRGPDALRERIGRSRSPASGGNLVLKADPRGVATFVRIDDGTPLRQEEFLMRYRVRNGITKFGTNAYFFQEGQASRFAVARYGEYRVDTTGEAILTNLRGRDLELLR
jgi:uncharacterized membrane-anchored protein